jgi:hypothetical protein
MIFYRHIVSITFCASKLQCEFSIMFDYELKKESEVVSPSASHLYEKVWEHTTNLFQVLCGFDMTTVIPSQWQHYDGPTIKRVFNSPIWKEVPYESFKASVYLRPDVYANRSIDLDFIDTCLQFFSTSQAYRGDELEDAEEILDFLNQTSVDIESALSGIAQIAKMDPYPRVRAMPAVWTGDSEFDLGENVYWIKGIVQTAKPTTSEYDNVSK